MDRGAWRATSPKGHEESDTTEATYHGMARLSFELSHATLPALELSMSQRDGIGRALGSPGICRPFQRPPLAIAELSPVCPRRFSGLFSTASMFSDPLCFWLYYISPRSTLLLVVQQLSLVFATP